MLSLGGILLYITFRYQFSFAIGAIVATIHDLLVTLAFLAFFQLRPDAERDRRAADDRRLLDQRHDRHFDASARTSAGCAATRSSTCMNLSINQTMGRTIITSGTALFSALALYLFGGEVLRGFAFTLIVG